MRFSEVTSSAAIQLLLPEQLGKEFINPLRVLLTGLLPERTLRPLTTHQLHLRRLLSSSISKLLEHS